MITGYRLEVTWTSGEDSSAEVIRTTRVTSTEALMTEMHELLHDTGNKSDLARICVEVVTDEDMIEGKEPW